MAAAYVQKAINGHNGTGVSVSVAFGGNVTAGNTIVVCCRSSGTAQNHSCADTLSNTYDKIIEDDAGGAHTVAYFVARNVTGGACTVTVTAVNNFRKGIAIREFSGLDTTAPEDQTATANGTGTAATNSNLTMTRDGVICGMVGHEGATITFDADYTETQENTTGRFGDCHRITTAITDNQAYTLSTSIQWTTLAANFMEPSVGGGGSFTVKGPFRTGF